MTSGNNSCLVEKLSYYMDLDDGAKGHLARLEKDQQFYDSQHDIYMGSSHNENLFVVKSGWLYSYTDLPDGRRQVVSLHHPGDVIGFMDIVFDENTTSLRSAEPVCLCPFPKKSLNVIFDETPRLAALLFSLAVREHAIFIDMIRAMGRMSARERITYLMLNTISRLRITNTKIGSTFRLPVTQTEIGDMLGLTNVYVNKTLRSLEEAEYIKRDGQWVTLLREDEMRKDIDFTDRYVAMDTSWFPDK